MRKTIQNYLSVFVTLRLEKAFYLSSGCQDCFTPKKFRNICGEHKGPSNFQDAYVFLLCHPILLWSVDTRTLMNDTLTVKIIFKRCFKILSWILDWNWVWIMVLNFQKMRPSSYFSFIKNNHVILVWSSTNNTNHLDLVTFFYSRWPPTHHYES